ncbi:MAG: hypothetical protein R2709_01865 [Marmoricola sp.]|nr:hypothetical protein [Nocardioidaceae bacterium]
MTGVKKPQRAGRSNTLNFLMAPRSYAVPGPSSCLGSIAVRLSTLFVAQDESPLRGR